MSSGRIGGPLTAPPHCRAAGRVQVPRPRGVAAAQLYGAALIGNSAAVIAVAAALF
jgi:hypothetical protein